MFLSRAPPPVSTMPLSTMSAASSGGVRSRATEHGLDDGVDRLGQRFADLVGVDHDGLRNAGHQVAALDLHRQLLLERVGVADGHLDALGRLLADGRLYLRFM